MHELSICGAIADAVIEHAAGRPVERIGVRIGAFTQVVPETLRFCWGLQTAESPLRTAGLDITYVAAVVRCVECATETTLDEPVLVCGRCGSSRVELIAGEELLVESIEVGVAEEVG